MRETKTKNLIKYLVDKNFGATFNVARSLSELIPWISYIILLLAYWHYVFKQMYTETELNTGNLSQIDEKKWEWLGMF